MRSFKTCFVENRKRYLKSIIFLGKNFGLFHYTTESLFSALAEENDKFSSAMLDSGSYLRQFASGATAKICCDSDLEVVLEIEKIASKYKFIWARLHKIEGIYYSLLIL